MYYAAKISKSQEVFVWLISGGRVTFYVLGVRVHLNKEEQIVFINAECFACGKPPWKPIEKTNHIQAGELSVCQCRRTDRQTCSGWQADRTGRQKVRISSVRNTRIMCESFSESKMLCLTRCRFDEPLCVYVGYCLVICTQSGAHWQQASKFTSLPSAPSMLNNLE